MRNMFGFGAGILAAKFIGNPLVLSFVLATIVIVVMYFDGKAEGYRPFGGEVGKQFGHNSWCNLLILGFLLFGPVGCVTKNNVVTKSVVPGPFGTNITTHEDHSWSVNQLGSSVNHNGNFLHFRAAVGGGAPPVGGRYGYDVGPGGYGYNGGGNGSIISVPIESQRYYEQETWRRYGFDGNGGGQSHHNDGNINADIQKFYNLSGPGGSGPRGYGY